MISYQNIQLYYSYSSALNIIRRHKTENIIECHLNWFSRLCRVYYNNQVFKFAGDEWIGKRCSSRKRKKMTNTTDVSDRKMTRLRQGVNLICEWHVRIKDEAKITSRRADWDDSLIPIRGVDPCWTPGHVPPNIWRPWDIWDQWSAQYLGPNI